MSAHDEDVLEDSLPDEGLLPDAPPPDRDALLAACKTLQGALVHPQTLAELNDEERKVLLMAAGRFARPTRKQQKTLRKELGKRDREDKKARDEALLDQRAIRQLRSEKVFPTPEPARLKMPDAQLLAESLTSITEAASPQKLTDDNRTEDSRTDDNIPQQEHFESVAEARKCYVCKKEFRELHHFYDQMCTECGDLNYAKRDETADLRGRYALVTGARVKIGYFAAIKLLRAGAHVVVTTRFPRDAAKRYAKEADFEDFSRRLEIYGADFRNARGVEELCGELLQKLPRLDYIVNNACQTVRRPPQFYQHMMDDERRLKAELDAREQKLLGNAATGANLDRPNAPLTSAELSQIALVPEDLETSAALFPTGQFDQDLQQIDLRQQNSWRLALSEVSLVELLEVQLVNSVAPFILNARLRELMKRVPTRDKHIVNVSAMEGQFYRAFKTDKHPHTNMAKAALNMMTRTSAPDYLKDGIHMNSVDTGWITDEDAAHIAERKRTEHRFHPPLDVVDGAARIVDPILDGMNTGKHVAGLFLKDYRAVPW